MDGRNNTVCFLTFNSKLFIRARTNGNQYGIIFFSKLLNADLISDSFIAADFNTRIQNRLNIMIQLFFWQPVVGIP